MLLNLLPCADHQGKSQYVETYLAMRQILIQVVIRIDPAVNLTCLQLLPASDDMNMPTLL